MPTIVLFMPWPQDKVGPNAGLDSLPGSGYVQKNRTWIAKYRPVVDGAAAIREVWYSFISNKLDQLSLLNQDDYVFIRGHGQPGYLNIYDYQTGGGSYGKWARENADLDRAINKNEPGRAKPRNMATALSPDLVCDRLMRCGLKLTFSGTIVCYNCWSGFGVDCFAQALANRMYARGFKTAQFVGFTDKLTSTPDEKGVARGGRGTPTSWCARTFIPQGVLDGATFASSRRRNAMARVVPDEKGVMRVPKPAQVPPSLQTLNDKFLHGSLEPLIAEEGNLIT